MPLTHCVCVRAYVCVGVCRHLSIGGCPERISLWSFPFRDVNGSEI